MHNGLPIPVGPIASGYFTDKYFMRTSDLVWETMPDVEVSMQVFQRNHAILAGMDEAVGIIKQACYGAGNEQPMWTNLSYMEPGHTALTIRALPDGSEIDPWETVMTIDGPYRLFAHLETVYLGILARSTLIATNTHHVVQAASGKPVYYFAARHDHYLTQETDGHAALIGGAASISTKAQGSWGGPEEAGTMPHSLIAAFGGDTVKAAIAFAERYKDETEITILVDFENDCSRTAVEVARALKERGLPLHAVRLDTSGSLVDVGVTRAHGTYGFLKGVCPALVFLVRDMLDSAGFEDVKIVVSGGFDISKIVNFESNSVPVDAYGVGSSLLRGSNDFTADIVRVNGKPCAKVGRQENPNPRLKVVI